MVLGPATRGELSQRRPIGRSVRPLQGGPAHRHPAVERDHEEVQGEADRDEHESRQPDVRGHEHQEDRVGGDQQANGDRVIGSGGSRCRKELQRQTEQGQWPPPQTNLRERAEAAAQGQAGQRSGHDRSGDQQHTRRLRLWRSGREGHERLAHVASE